MLVILYGLLLISVAFITIILGKIIYEKNVVERITSEFEDRYKKRAEAEEKRRSLEGNVSKIKFINTFDEMLDRSGLKEKYSFLNSEVYISITLIIALLFYLLSKFIYNFIAFNLIIAIAVCFISYLIVYYRSGIIFQKIDNEIMSFINNIENFSTTSKDIVTIFEEVIPFTGDPLTKFLQEFVVTAKSSGDVRGAFVKLERRLENDDMVTLLKNLEMASRNSANYTEIIKEARKLFKKYFKQKNKRKLIIDNGRQSIIIVILVGLVMVYAVNSFIGGQLIQSLSLTLFGNVLLGIGILIIIAALWLFISMDRG